jgi:hypothetical protein
MGKFRWFSYGALAIGALMLIITLALWNKTRNFIAHAEKAPGTVTEMLEVLDKDDKSPMYKPVVAFTTRNGEAISFTSSFSSRPPAYVVGEQVEVLYDPRNHLDARINGFGSLWLGPWILGGMGTLFTAIGISIILAGRMGEKKKDYLMAYGSAIQTDLQGVDRNTSLTVNGRNPWRVTSQWLDPASNKLRIFHSENLWFDPAKFLTAKQVTVLVDPKDPKRYYMDLSFLPQTDDA